MLFVLSVYYFPSGVVGRLRELARAQGRRLAGRAKTRWIAAAFVAHRRSLVAALAALLLAASAGARSPPMLPFRGRPPAGTSRRRKRKASPSSALADLVDFGAQNEMDSLLVVRHGRIVAEAYYAPFRPGMRHLVNSVTKAVVGTLAGIAVQRGEIASVDEPVLESFRWRTVANAEGSKAQLKIAHLLDMTSGLDWNEPLTAAPPETMLEMARSRDWVGFVLDRPMAHAARHRLQLQQRRLAPGLGDPRAQDRPRHARVRAPHAVRAARHRRRDLARRPAGRPQRRLRPVAAAARHGQDRLPLPAARALGGAAHRLRGVGRPRLPRDAST